MWMKKLQEARGFLAYLLHPPNGYLLPLAVLVAAIPLSSIALTMSREAWLRNRCALTADFYGKPPGGGGWAAAKVKALGLPKKMRTKGDSRNPNWAIAEEFCKHYK